MDTLSQINEALKNNSNLTPEIRKNLFSLVQTFHNTFSNIDLNNLRDRLKDLRIESGSKYAYKEVSKYNPSSNTLVLNMDELQKNHDMQHVMMSEILNIITAKDNFVGFNKDNKNVALNVGFNEILTNNLVGNESDHNYHIDEQIEANIIGNMLGFDTLYKAYFTNDFNLIDRVVENADLKKAMIEMNFNYQNENEKQKSDLPNIILDIYKVSLRNGSYIDMCSIYDGYLMPADCFEKPEMYQDMKYVINFHNTIKQNMIKANQPEILEEVQTRKM